VQNVLLVRQELCHIFVKVTVVMQNYVSVYGTCERRILSELAQAITLLTSSLKVADLNFDRETECRNRL
jgi:hypothetical protein